MKKGSMFFILLFVVLISAIVISFQNNEVSGTPITVYKSPTCGCCVKYVPYLENKDFDADVQAIANMREIKNRYNIPQSMESCHTAIIGDYFVEGHVPMEAINKLLLEQPDIDGISLPGMPSGSPGMPGVKRGDFIIYAISDGEISEFMRL